MEVPQCGTLPPVVVAVGQAMDSCETDELMKRFWEAHLSTVFISRVRGDRTLVGMVAITEGRADRCNNCREQNPSCEC